MRGRSKFLLGAAGVFLAALSARAQTAVWTGGGGGNINFSNGANWMGGSPPPNDGSNTVDLTPAAAANINIDSNASVAGIFFEGSSGTTQYSLNDASGILSIGSGGISKASEVNANLYFGAAINLTANQTWDLPFINQVGGVISGNFSISTTGSAFMFGQNTFTGGVNVLSGTFYVGSGPSAGTGTITLSDNAALNTFFSPDTLANLILLGNNDTLATAANTPLTLTGPITFVNASTTLNLGSNTQVIMSGTLSGTSPTQVEVNGLNNSSLPADGGSQLVIQGALGQLNALTVSNTQVILAPVTTDPATSYPNVAAGGFQVVNQGYLGLDGTFATKPGAVAAFISTYGPSLGANIDGSLGFDTSANPTSPQTFADPVDLSSFSSGGFLGLGSATSAILSGSITPSPIFGGAYVFGGGGGTLTITSDLEDFEGTSLVMTNAPAPVTVIIHGANNYEGSVLSQGGVLIFDSAVLPLGGIELSGGYVGYTETPGLSSAAFMSLFDNFGSGVLGFDQHTPDPSMPRQIGDTIDMTYFNSDSTVFIGTATAAELTSDATIFPANNQYRFTGVKGGILTVDTPLTDQDEVVTGLAIGLQTPIESNGSTSTVKLTGDNSFTGGTTFNSGNLLINSNTAFGTGPITIPDPSEGIGTPYLASYGGSPVTIMNPISVGSRGSAQGVTLGNTSPTGSDMLVLGGVISDETTPFAEAGLIAIGGPVTLAAANTYTGGTIFTGTGNALALVTNSMAFGTGSINIQDGATIAASDANVTLANPITLSSSPLNLGQNNSNFTLVMNGVISGTGTLNIDSAVVLNGINTYSGSTVINDAEVSIGSSSPFGTSTVTLQNDAFIEYESNPTILDFTGDTTTGITLQPGQTLTLDADATGGNFRGAINGDGSNSLVKIDSGVQRLGGINSYGGGTTVSAGTLIAGTDASLGTGPVTVGSGADLGVTSGATLTMPITLSGNSTLSGSGAFSPPSAVVIDNGNNVMPGNPIPGQYIASLSFETSVTFGTGGVYTLNVANAAGVASVDYSTLQITGALTISAAPGSFEIAVNSVTPGGGPGLATFDPTVFYSWTILSAGSIAAFDPTDFTINTSNFQNPLAGGSFSLGQSGNTLVLDFTPVPEPSTWTLMLGGLAAAGAAFCWQRRVRARAIT